MFSFHKPRVYRSAEGCCICRAKSSSSRFTDSRKYEEDSMKCFNLKYPRYGEICNACVLLVKRYKRLPVGSQRHWGHVVDARAGTKTLMKVKRNKEEIIAENSNSRESHNVPNNKSVISEKFSKIFKKSKNKKLNMNALVEESNKKAAYKSLHNKMTLFKRNDSVESDNGDSRESSPIDDSSPKTDVQFQTQTRSTQYRTKNNSKSLNSQKTGVKKTIVKCKSVAKISGSKRRKKFKPQKNRLSIDSNVRFFDDEEWSKRTTCCGIVYECSKLPGATIIDLDHYKMCMDHQRRYERSLQEKVDVKQFAEITQKSIKATLPAVVKLNLPLAGSSANINPTPVLKKHHLFYKRQSERFPNGEMTPTPIESKTEINSQALNLLTEAMNTSKIQITTTHQQQSHNSNAKVTTTIGKAISTNEASCSTAAAAKSSSSFLHRIKSDAGKIVKHSIEKFNSAMRLKSHDVVELKKIVKTVDKSVIMPKSVAQNILLKIPDLSPTSSSSTKFSDNSSDSGFDENVQDRKSISPLQHENDAKIPSKSPVQTLILASGVRVHGQQQNLVYAGNEAAAKILQNRLQQKITTTHGNSNNGTILQHNQRLNVQPITIDPSTALKLVQTKNNNNNVISIAPYNLPGVKMRPLYNTTTNAIQHENGITTIVPASSLDIAAKQNETFMQTNSVTITPSPTLNNQTPINLNQKFILLKTNAHTTFGHTYNKGLTIKSASTE